MSKVVIVCDACQGSGHFDQVELKTNLQVEVECPQCEGSGGLTAKRWKEKKRKKVKVALER